jgi:glutamine amidotransferase PdxT
LNSTPISSLVRNDPQSTTMANICRRWNLFEPLRDFAASGGAVWGTCAGLIFLADRIGRGAKQGGQELLGGLDVTVDRNFFGSQARSITTPVPVRPRRRGERDSLRTISPGVLSSLSAPVPRFRSRRAAFRRRLSTPP